VFCVVVKSDDNSFVALIAMCETMELQWRKIVPGFASRDNATLPPLTLRLHLAE